MSVKKGSSVVSVVTKLLQPVAVEQGLSLWDIEFVKEGAVWYLRIYIDKPEGVTLDDCELFHRRIDTMLDEADPIDHSYCLEVSSPGIERELKNPWHYEIMMGKQICIRLIRPDLNGRRELKGILKGYTDGVITLQNENEQIQIRQFDTSFVKLNYEFDETNKYNEIDNVGGIK
jgi:ribosome maturation factor RimP